MKCPHCGRELRDDARFCDNCGKELLKACPWEDCADYGKAILPMRAKFCPRCGRPLEGQHKQTRVDVSELNSEELSRLNEELNRLFNN